MKIKSVKKRCSKKLCYTSEGQARSALRQLKHTGVKRFYKCPYHKGENIWHLTSESK